MNHDTELKLQAYLDGELSPAESQCMAEQLAHEPTSQALYQEIRSIKTVLAGNEMELELPEPRPFYWSKIASAIEQPAAERLATPTAARALAGWWRWAVPLGGVALLTLFFNWHQWFTPPPARLAIGHEIEVLLEETTAFNFRSETDAMSVVWVSGQQDWLAP